MSVPYPRKGFSSNALRDDPAAAYVASGWWTLEKKIAKSFNAELNLLSKAIGRAEWLAMG